MTANVVSAAYIVSAVLFVLSLAGLSKHESAKEGNAFGVTGMVIALGATIWLTLSRSEHALVTLLLIALAMGIGAAIGLWRARKVEMTQMPELVAMLHSFVGLAAVLVGHQQPPHRGRRLRHDPLGRGLPRRVHRRGDPHRLDRRVPQAVGADPVDAAHAAGAALAQPGRARRLGAAAASGSSSRTRSCRCSS